MNMEFSIKKTIADIWVTLQILSYCNIYVLFFFPSHHVAVANPCIVNNGGCSGICSRTTDGRVCLCNPGFSLDFDGVTCVGTEVALPSSAV